MSSRDGSSTLAHARTVVGRPAHGGASRGRPGHRRSGGGGSGRPASLWQRSAEKGDPPAPNVPARPRNRDSESTSVVLKAAVSRSREVPLSQPWMARTRRDVADSGGTASLPLVGRASRSAIRRRRLASPSRGPREWTSECASTTATGQPEFGDHDRRAAGDRAARRPRRNVRGARATATERPGSPGGRDGTSGEPGRPRRDRPAASTEGPPGPDDRDGTSEAATALPEVR
jgi:hypothetical protein